MEVASQPFMTNSHQEMDTMDIDIDMDVDVDVELDEPVIAEDVELEVCACSYQPHPQRF
jgi:hypothetical protein